MTAINAQVTKAFEENALLPILFGPANTNLERLEQKLGVSVSSRGNQVTIAGPQGSVETARQALDALYDRARRGQDIATADVDAALRMTRGTVEDGMTAIATKKRQVEARSPGQAEYMRAMRKYNLVFGIGPAGTGKTYLAVAQAVALKVQGVVDRIILSRPAVEAGERLGFLPGDMRDKVDPYLRPLYDALYDMLPGEYVAKALVSGEIEVAPLAFMRGRTLSNAFIILDEAQNTTPTQMKMFLTRLGENSRMVITGDLSQIDLPLGAKSGLADASDILGGLDGITFVRFTHKDVVRHDLVTRIVRAYDSRDGLLAAPGDD